MRTETVFTLANRRAECLSGHVSEICASPKIVPRAA
jgi:hypothetical protein